MRISAVHILKYHGFFDLESEILKPRWLPTLALPECNSMGLGLMGGGTLPSALRALKEGTADTLIVLENDLYRRADAATVESFFKLARDVVVLDQLLHDTARKATLVLPAGAFAEVDGTLVNSEGRAQRYFKVVAPTAEIQESWRWLSDGLARVGRAPHPPWSQLDDVIAACARAIPALSPITRAAPSADFRVSGSKIAREPHRYSGRTAIDAGRTIHEPKPPDDPDTPFSYSMEGYYGPLPSALIPYFWTPGWNSVRALNKFQEEVGGALRGGDPGVRLIEPRPQARPRYFDKAPAAFKPRREEWIIAPLYEVFGSEELSGAAPAVRERVPAPYVALNPQDAARLHVGEGGLVAVSVEDVVFRLRVKVQPALPPGVAGAVMGLSGSIDARLPTWGKITPAYGISEVSRDE